MKNKAKKHFIIYGSKNHNRQQYNQEPNIDSDFEALEKKKNDESMVLSDTKST